MANSMFEQFKLTLEMAIQDEDFRRKNCLFQDGNYLQDMISRIKSLTPDVSITQGFGDIISLLGMIEQDTLNSRIKFSTRGFETTLSAFREGRVRSPYKIWRRYAVGSQDRFLVSDRESGVLVLNDHLELLYRFPNYGPDIVGQNEYNDSTGCCTFEIAGTEYIAIVMLSHHICSIYEYNAPYSHVATIGVVDTPGDIANYLNQPVGVSFNAATNELFIASQLGQPTGATLDRGFISVYDVSTPSAPVFVDSPIFYENSGSLLDVECDNPADVFVDDGLLWVCNGNDEVAALDISASPYRCAKFVEPTGQGYAFHAPRQAYVHSTVGGYKYLYVANGAVGSIEEFDQLTLKHLNSYGYRASEDELNSLNRLSDSVYGAIGYTQAVTADRIVIDGKETDVLICADTLNKRLQQFNLNTYSTNNFANFAMLEFDTPIMVNGWSLSGDVPLDMVRVYYRFKETEDFRELPQETSLYPTSSIQFRVAIQLDRKKFVRDWYIRYLRIHGTQA